MLVGRKDKAGFLFCQKCLSHLRDWTFPRGLFLVVEMMMLACSSFFSHTLCRAWTADYHSLPLSAISCPHVSSTLSHAKPSVKKKKKKRGMPRISRSWEKGTESSSHFYFSPQPEHEAMISWASTVNTMGIHFAEHRQCHRVQHLGGHQTNTAESAPSNIFLRFCF